MSCLSLTRPVAVEKEDCGLRAAEVMVELLKDESVRAMGQDEID
jgi:hypothetical protein